MMAGSGGERSNVDGESSLKRHPLTGVRISQGNPLEARFSPGLPFIKLHLEEDFSPIVDL